jgi:Family of unknown function (DUF5677)
MEPGDSDPNLSIVSDFADELKAALDSLGGKDGEMFEHYRLHAAKHIQRAVDGFVYLRKSGRFDASKFLVRPAIEVVFKLQAIERQPDLLYRIAFSEHLQDQRMARPAAERSNQLYDQATADAHWASFSAKYQDKLPNHQFVEQELRIYETAEKANLAAYYDSHYRLYSQYTHGTFRAMTGSFDDLTDSEDGRVMALCAWVALEVLISIGAKSPNRDELVKRLPQNQP